MSVELETKSARTAGATARVAASVMRVLVHLHNLPKKRMLMQAEMSTGEAAVADLIGLTNRSRNS